MKQSSKSISFIQIVLLAVVAIAVIYSSFLSFWMPTLGDGDALQRAGQFGDSFGALSSIFSALAFVGVIATIQIQQKQIQNQELERKEEVAERRSLFNLNATARAYEQAYSLLSDGNNDRATWIRASRILMHSRTLASGITVEEHQIDLEVRRLEYRPLFSEVLESKTGSFFYGSENATDINVAAQASTARTNDAGLLQNVLTSIPEEAIYAIWKASQWPSNYDDPINEKFTENDEDQLLFNHRGLRDYIEHRRQWISVLGNLRARAG